METVGGVSRGTGNKEQFVWGRIQLVVAVTDCLQREPLVSPSFSVSACRSSHQGMSVLSLSPDALCQPVTGLSVIECLHPLRTLSHYVKISDPTPQSHFRIDTGTCFGRCEITKGKGLTNLWTFGSPLTTHVSKVFLAPSVPVKRPRLTPQEETSQAWGGPDQFLSHSILSSKTVISRYQLLSSLLCRR